jgi:telomerase reverse transcriptase
MSKSDEMKRRQLLGEFIYWFFDTFLIPLLRAHFYITESNVDRNRIFYFRHDVWKKLSEPTLNELKTSMFQEIQGEKAKEVLSDRNLGYTQLRLLPKEHGVRPIMNLRRRETKIVRKIDLQICWRY